MSEKCSRIERFYKKSHDERLDILKKFANLSETDISILKTSCSLSFEAANRMVENAVSTMPIPLGIATNFLINNKDYLIPMAIEEPSVIAAASSAAKLARASGGFQTSSSSPLMLGQIQIVQIPNSQKAISNINKNKQSLLELANKQDALLVELGGGAVDLKLKEIFTARGQMLIASLFVDVKDAMGANIVNTMAEKIAPNLEQLSGGKISLRIISNLAIHRTAKAKAVWKKDVIAKKGENGQEIIDGILNAYAFAQHDPFRCVTHNKGIMNGIDAVALATGNDFRAIEAGAHAFASFNQKYEPLTKYYTNADGDIVGEIELPLAVGIIGGITQTHPTAKLCLKILGIQTSCELAQIFAAVGLAQNFAALRALVTHGIQASHMKLHSKNIAITAGACDKTIDIVAERMCEENNVSISRAKEILKELTIQQ